MVKNNGDEEEAAEMKLAICEDNQKERLFLENQISRYCTPDGKKISYDVFDSGIELLNVLEKNNYDLLILDILMPGFDGLRTSKEIRSINETIPIIFITSSTEYAVESYRVHAFDYLMKPLNTALLYQDLDQIYRQLKQKESESLTIHKAKEIHVVSLDELVCLEVQNRILSFHLLEKETIRVTGHLMDYEETLLKRPEFLKVHRSFIINMNLMQSFHHSTFTTLTGLTVPIARTLSKTVQKTYMEHLRMSI